MTETLTRKQIEDIRDRGNFPFGIVGSGDINKLCDMALRTLAAESRLAEAKREGWIAVSERNPEDGHRALVHWSLNYDFTEIAIWHHAGHFISDKGCQLFGVTHWQPLPAPPGTAAPREEHSADSASTLDDTKGE